MPNPILIAVPPHLVPAVTELIANDDAEAGLHPQGTPGDDLVNGWREEPLRQHYRDSSEKMRAFLIYLAEHADSDVTSHDAAQAIGSRDWNSVAGMLGAAQRRAKNHFGRYYGPWNRRWAADDQVRLRMPAAAATIILDEARAQGDR